MNRGHLSQYFTSVGAKRLSSVEIDKNRSNQHEFNGTRGLKQIFGENVEEKARYDTQFIWFGGENEVVFSNGFVTWYESRKSHATRSEFRLFYSERDNRVIDLARPGDMLFIALRPDKKVMVVLTPYNSAIENQLLWLFGLDKTLQSEVQEKRSFSVQRISGEDDRSLDFIVRFILDELGIEPEEPDSDLLDRLISDAGFGLSLPDTKTFSDFARKSLQGFVNPLDDPDHALVSWMDREEMLFRRMERAIIENRIRQGFIGPDGTDVDGFISFSLGVQNRRKSRAGRAFENHVEEILSLNKIGFSRTVVTEYKSKPDFLFPGIKEYQNMDFPSDYLTMLAAKTTCKDRWRQILVEAKRISKKHLLTLEPGISEPQTDEMKANQVQLVLPRSIHETYKENQRSWIFSLSEFIELVRERQKEM